MDSFTMAMPQPVRAAVAQLALRSGSKGSAKSKRERVLKLDPANAELNHRFTVVGVDPADALTLNAEGLKQESEGDPCTAEDTFTEANSKAIGGSSEYLRNMGRAAYECGRYAYSVSEFSAAEDHDASELKANPDDADDLNPDLTYDREWLSLAYSTTKQPQLANEACLRAHTTWKACRCTLKDKKPSCMEVGARAIR
jgi:tetratricopeptide (TPR) repeat protein